jgi:hypothetical protein
MPFAQTHYSQKLGTGIYSIAEAGCFVTAFSNLLERFGQSVDPPTLNNFFTQNNRYTHDPSEPAGTADNVYWGTVSAYNGEILPVGLGGAGWPDSNDAIVKFIYRSPRTGASVTHFTLVSNSAAHTIVDSWDGVTKVSPYGTPLAWAKYERHVAQPVSPPPAPEIPTFTIETIANVVKELKYTTKLWDLNQRSWPQIANNPVSGHDAGYQFATTQIAHHALGGEYYIPSNSNGSQGFNVVDCQDIQLPVVPPPAPVLVIEPVIPAAPVYVPPSAPVNYPTDTTPYTIVKQIDGYSSATDAGNHANPKAPLAEGDYYVFRRYPGRDDLINITKDLGKPGDLTSGRGGWINTADNVIPAVVEPPKPVYAPTNWNPPVIPEPVPEPVTSWQSTYRSFLNPIHYVSTRQQTVSELSGQQPHLTLPRYDPTGTSKTGVVSAYGTVTKDGIEYYRLKIDSDKNFSYWYCIAKIDSTTHTPNLLVKPVDVTTPVAKTTVARDGIQLVKSRLEVDAIKFLDDILPKFFQKKK